MCTEVNESINVAGLDDVGAVVPSLSNYIDVVIRCVASRWETAHLHCREFKARDSQFGDQFFWVVSRAAQAVWPVFKQQERRRFRRQQSPRSLQRQSSAPWISILITCTLNRCAMKSSSATDLTSYRGARPRRCVTPMIHVYIIRNIKLQKRRCGRKPRRAHLNLRVPFVAVFSRCTLRSSGSKAITRPVGPTSFARKLCRYRCSRQCPVPSCPDESARQEVVVQHDLTKPCRRHTSSMRRRRMVVQSVGELRQNLFSSFVSFDSSFLKYRHQTESHIPGRELLRLDLPPQQRTSRAGSDQGPWLEAAGQRVGEQAYALQRLQSSEDSIA